MDNEIKGKKLNFKEIFETKFSTTENEKVQIKTIEIPMMQRDYAHGRKLPKVNSIRANILKDIFETIIDKTKKELTLDFIYGDLKSDKLIPLDGQQRLTTMFLLYWYALKKEHIESNEFSLYEKFNYETRVSARRFCEFLIKDFQPDFTSGVAISKQIKNNKKFPLSYSDDPTVASMLVMIDAINKKYDKSFENFTSGLYKGLNEKIKFSFLPIENMGNPEQLYINMNSRGKPLTDFENVKAELKKLMEENKIDKEFIETMMNSFDGKWTDAIWELCDKKTDLIDKIFIQYIRFVCDILCFENKELSIDKRVPEDENWDNELTITQLVNKYFSKDKAKDAKKNIEKLNEYLTFLVKLKDFEKSDKYEYFYSVKNETTDYEKIRDFLGFSKVVEDCILKGEVKRIKPTEFLKLYTIISSFKNEKTSTDELKRRFRILRNLILNSSDEAQVRRKKDNHLPLALKQIDYIMKEGKIADLSSEDIKIEFEDNSNDYQRTDFNTNQKDEETKKSKFYYNEKYKNLLLRLEDNKLLQGRISIIGMEPKYWTRFEKLFKFCNRELIDKAMMVISEGIYGIDEKGKHQFGLNDNNENSVLAWHNIFQNWDKQQEKYINAEKLKTILDIEELDSINENGENKEIAENELKKIVDTYIENCKKRNLYDFRYYYVYYYEDFKPVGYGIYDYQNESEYEVWVMETQIKRSSNSYQPFLKHYVNDENAKYDGQLGIVALNLNEEMDIKSKKEGLLITNKNKEERLIITIGNEGIDKTDRIELLGKIIKNPSEYWNNAKYLR